ncbi:unnamed protein product [Absidia cylindrospora]
MWTAPAPPCSFFIEIGKPGSESVFLFPPLIFSMVSLNLPADVLASADGTRKLFNKWSYEDVEVKDISLQDYISVRQHVTCPTLLVVSLPSVSVRLNAPLLNV